MNQPRRRFLQTSAVLAAAAAWPFRANAATAYKNIPKAMYVWNLEAASVGTQVDALLLYASKYGINKLYVFVDREWRERVLAGRSSAISALNKLKNSGRHIEALIGEHSWAETPDRLSQTIHDLATIHTRHGVFRGIHFDVEPHTLDAWDDEANRPALMEGLARFLANARGALPQTLRVEATLHPKHAGVVALPDGTPFLTAIKPAVDEVSLMAYRDTPQKQIEWANNSVPQLETLGLPWRMAVLTNQGEAGTTYYGKSASSFRASMEQLWSLMGGFSDDKGLAHENYESLRRILRP